MGRASDGRRLRASTLATRASAADVADELSDSDGDVVLLGWLFILGSESVTCDIPALADRRVSTVDVGAARYAGQP
jgi:hypothetical protein